MRLGKLGAMELETVVDELYGLPPKEFVAVRDARSSEARAAGAKDLAASIKECRKPTVGAWMANVLSRDNPSDLERLIGLGDALRSNRKLDGEQIRRVTKDKNDTVARLIGQAKASATRVGQPVSHAAELDLEATLEASFADPASAVSVREGRLVEALHYSGFGLGSDPERLGAPLPAKGRSKGGAGGPDPAAEPEARRAVREWERQAESADDDVAKAKRAVTSAEAELKRLRASLTVAERRSAKAREGAAAAREKLDSIRRRRI